MHWNVVLFKTLSALNSFFKMEYNTLYGSHVKNSTSINQYKTSVGHLFPVLVKVALFIAPNLK